MKVKLLRDARINHAAGDIVEVSPETAHFLVSTYTAVHVVEKATKEPEEAEKAVKTPKATKTAAKTVTKRTKK